MEWLLSCQFLMFSSGIIGGKFLERGRIKKPDQDIFKSEMSEYFTASDLFVGAKVTFNNFDFVISDADEYAFRYMEQHAAEVSRDDMASLWCFGSFTKCGRKLIFHENFGRFRVSSVIFGHFLMCCQVPNRHHLPDSNVP